MPKTEALVLSAERGVRGLEWEGGVGELQVLRAWGDCCCVGGPQGSRVLGFGSGLGLEGGEVEDGGSGFGIAAAERMGDALAWAGAAGVVEDVLSGFAVEKYHSGVCELIAAQGFGAVGTWFCAWSWGRGWAEIVEKRSARSGRRWG